MAIQLQAPDIDVEVQQPAAPTQNGISADEIALYDRQIRLWGVQAQEKIRNANVFLVTVKGLGNEIAKNLVLSGIGSITLLDQDIVTEDDLGSQFLVSEADYGKPRAEAALPEMQKLNPRVTIKVETQNILDMDLSTLSTYFTQYTLVVATDLAITGLETYNSAAHFARCPFYAAGTHGLYGFLFADLVEHTYLVTRDKPNVATKPGPETATREILSSIEKRADNGKMTEIVTKREKYQPLILANQSPLPAYYTTSQRRLRSVTPLLPCLRALWTFEKSFSRLPGLTSDPAQVKEDLKIFTTLATEKCAELRMSPDMLKAEFLRSFMSNLGSEMAMTTSFVGAAAAQDIGNVLMGKDQPVQNMMFFDGETMAAPVYALTPTLT